MEKRTCFAYEKIRQILLESPVVGADETGHSLNGKPDWAWVLQNPNLTYIKAGLSRRKEEFEAIVSNGLSKSALVSDCYSVYFSARVATHQLCTAHLLRELKYLEELYDKHPWTKKMQTLIRDAIHLRKTLEGKINIEPFMQRLKILLEEGYYSALQKCRFSEGLSSNKFLLSLQTKTKFT